MAFPRSDLAAPTPTTGLAPTTVKIVVAGGFAVGKTTLIGSISDIEPLRTEAALTEHSVGVDDAGNELPSGGCFTHVAVGNPGSVEAFSRVVAVALDSPADGPQGALEVVVLTPQPIAIPARTQVVVTPPPDAYAAIANYFGSSFVTVKAFPAAD